MWISTVEAMVTTLDGTASIYVHWLYIFPLEANLPWWPACYGQTPFAIHMPTDPNPAFHGPALHGRSPFPLLASSNHSH